MVNANTTNPNTVMVIGRTIQHYSQRTHVVNVVVKTTTRAEINEITQRSIAYYQRKMKRVRNQMNVTTTK